MIVALIERMRLTDDENITTKVRDGAAFIVGAVALRRWRSTIWKWNSLFDKRRNRFDHVSRATLIHIYNVERRQIPNFRHAQFCLFIYIV